MKITVTEDQIARIKAKLKENQLNEDYLDDLISKGGNFVNKSVTAVKDFISGLEIPVVKKQEDVPETADFIGDNVEDFFKIRKGDNFAVTVYEKFIEVIQTSIGSHLKTGIFGADMKVSLINDGPVTIQIDSKNKA